MFLEIVKTGPPSFSFGTKKARDPKSPEREIEKGLNCRYDGLSKLILSFTHSSKIPFSCFPA